MLEPSLSPLHVKWLSNSKDLKQIEEVHGIQIHKGAFSKEDDEIMKKIMKEFQIEHNMSDEVIYQLVNKSKSKDITKDLKDLFWRCIASPFPNRPLQSVYHRMNRMLHPLNEKGWTEEDLLRLNDLVAQYGKDWQQIGTLMGRMPENCRSRHKCIPMTNQIVGRVYWKRSDTLLFLRLVLQHLCQNDEVTEGELKVALDKHLQDWTVLQHQFNQSSPIEPRYSDQLRYKWTRMLHLDLLLLYDTEKFGQKESYTISEIVEIMDSRIRQCQRRIKKKQFSDQLLVASVIKQFPEGAKIRWSKIKKDLDTSKPKSYLKKRYSEIKQAAGDQDLLQFIKTSKAGQIHSKKGKRKFLLSAEFLVSDDE